MGRLPDEAEFDQRAIAPLATTGTEFKYSHSLCETWSACATPTAAVA